MRSAPTIDGRVRHIYSAERVGRPNPHIRALAWDAQGWRIASPEPKKT